jgi:catalase
MRLHFLNEAYRHCKAIAADKEAIQILQATYFGKKIPTDISKAPELMDGVLY